MKHRAMSSREWLAAFFGTLLLLAVSVMAFNYYTDPFGAFGDRFLQWWSYDETLNPRVAKLSYLEQNHEQYDSYIIGPSGTSSYPVERLNEYFDANFYNLIMYGSDMKDVELTCRYLIDHYTVDNLVVNLYIKSAMVYDVEEDPLTDSLHYKVDGSSPLQYYAKYLLIDPRIGWEKLQHRKTDSYLQQAYRVFDAQSGAYDKSKRDAEPIGSLAEYLTRDTYDIFNHYPQESYELSELENCVASVESIVRMCEEADVRLMFVCTPMYHEFLSSITPQQQADFRNALSLVTDYWDFTLSDISYDPRYFYDATHFRNCVGEMALAKAFGDDSIYCPENLGVYVAKGETVGPWTGELPSEESYTAQVPILLYHSVAQEGGGDSAISVERFTEHMEALCTAGYTTVSFEDLRAYVEAGVDLPEKPIMITFDDGYRNNYTMAYPVLERLNMKATVFAIGVSVGKDTYKETGVAMEPHFSREEAEEMEATGLIAVESHGYDIHHVAGRDEEPLRAGAVMLDGENDWAYAAFLQEDCEKFAALMGREANVLSYPYGVHSELSEVVLREAGIWATVTSEAKINTIVKGLPQSLRQMGRYNITQDLTAEDLLELLNSAETN